MEEQNKIDAENKEIKDDLKSSSKDFFSSLITYFKTVLSIREGVDFQGTTEGIKRDVDFKGHNVWILAASIVIASIGLNVNSTALIIGAMLISPLMGPIVGLGLAIGTNDLPLVFRSLKSLGTAVLISVLVSAIYFALTPFGEVQSEIIARTRPTLLDVIVAILGGVAGIVAGSRKEKTNVIPGVAIATALMPPLCTAGYGLANGNWNFFFGAFYLFLINTVLITLSTWLIVKYLQFPLASYIDAVKEKKVKRYILIFTVLIVLPSGFTFWDTIKESIFESNAQKFIVENFVFEGTDVINTKLKYKSDTLSTIDLYLIGEILPAKTERELKVKLNNYGLEKAELRIHQSKDKTNEIAGRLSAEVKSGILEEIYRKNEEILNNKDAKIEFLEDELIKLQGDTIPFNSIKEELKVQYKDVVTMTYGKTISTNFKTKQDTISTFFIRWNAQVEDEVIATQNIAMQNWLRVRLQDKKVRVIRY